MTTITTAEPTEIQTAAAEATAALKRLFELARANYDIDGVVKALDALAAADGPLNALSEQFGELDDYLSDFDPIADDEYDAIHDAIGWLPCVTGELDSVRATIDSTANSIRDLFAE